MINRKREFEREQRRGLGRRFLVQFLLLIVAAVIAYFFARYALSGQLVETFTHESFYQNGIPRSISETGVELILAFGIFLIIETCLYLGFMIASPGGRRKAGQASMHSYNKDHQEHKFHD